MSEFNTAADIARSAYILDQARTKRAALKYLKESAIENRAAILASYKKEMRLQAYPCYALMLFAVIGMLLMLCTDSVLLQGIGMLSFGVCFFTMIIWVVITVILFRKDIYPEFINWFQTAHQDELERALHEPSEFKNGKLKFKALNEAGNSQSGLFRRDCVGVGS